MNSSAMLNAAVESIGNRIANAPAAEAVFTRLLKTLEVSLLPALLTDKASAQELLSNPDSQFVEELLLKYQIESARSTREAEKLRKREAANRRFFDKLKVNGGLYKAGEVATKLGVSRQAIAKQRDSGKLVFIRDGHDFVFPAFQFADGKKLPYLEDILKLLPDGFSGVAQCSFFLNDMEMLDGNMLSPSAALSMPEVNPDYVKHIKHQAALFGRHVAK
ncbi:helix-turn-helix domain-containing protein [Rheinheimera hassiensis]|uniref:helix-turn-helix domain-containing protein n=1 Tax=Rheinheimera hassiensis TaxID=1193627 RepID=UPI001F0599D2|nr:helix-turn-helix domain-containing protein [Rheinheimera hassiensis]